MELKYDHTLLFVDDEKSILSALKRLFRKQPYRIQTAESGQQALDLLGQADTPVSLIISDQRMPGMNGATFLEQSREIAPDAFRFLLTGYSDMDAVVDAVNKGKIHRYLVKPWDDAELMLLVRETLAQVEMKRENIRLTELTQRQNQELAALNQTLEERVEERTWALKCQNKKLQQLNKGLEKSLRESVRLLLTLVESSNPRLGGCMRATGKLARQIAETAGLDAAQQDQVEMAGLVCDIGLLGISDQILEKDERSLSPKEFATYAQHPEIAVLSLASVSGLKAIGDMVAAHHENVDGSGFPHGLAGDDLPIGAKILAVAGDYCMMLHLWPKVVRRMLSVARRYSSQDALDMVEYGDDASVREEIAKNVILEGAGKRYDKGVVRSFLSSIGSDTTLTTIEQMGVGQLRPGVMLVEDLCLKDGRTLLTRGTTLNRDALKIIKDIGERGMIKDLIPVMIPTSVETGGRGGA